MIPALRIGAHFSVAGSLEQAAVDAHAAGANTMQIFTSSPRMWRASRPAAQDVVRFRAARQKLDIAPLVVHGNYLANLASTDAAIRARSIESIRGELLRAMLVGADYLVIHPGSYKDQSVVSAIEAIAAGLREASRGVPENGVTLLLENTAGQGASVGSRVEELQAIRRLVEGDLPVRTGYCLDTCHCFAAGIDLVEAAAQLGFDDVPVIHANDSKHPRGSRLDRHEQIGVGHIGDDAFRRMLTHPELRGKAFVLEVPFEADGDEARNIGRLRALSAAA